MQNKNIISWSSLAVLALLFLALVMLSNVLFRGARLDLTENKLYTLNQGTLDLLSSVEEPIQLRLFFSEEASRDFPLFRTYYDRVREVLQEFEQRSSGKVQVSFIDPKPFSEEEDQASLYGLQAVPVGGAGDNLYFGLAGTNAVDGVEIMPFLDPRRERFLEYELAKLVYSLDHPDRPRLGLISSFNISGGFDPHTQQPSEPYVVYEQLAQLYDVVKIEETDPALPENLDVLMIVHPKNITSTLMYDIDQYVLSGGGLMVFVDPYAQNDLPPGATPGPGVQPGSSDLPKLFKAWGIKYRPNFWAGDLRYALEVNSPSGPTRHVGILGLSNEAMSHEDVVTANLNGINASTVGFFHREDETESKVQIEPLLFTSENSQPISSLLLSNTTNVNKLLQNFESSGEIFNLAVRLSGTAESAFPEGAPDTRSDEHRGEGSINVILVGDTEMLSDLFWVQKQSFFGQTVSSPFAANGDFVLNIAENLAGSSGLASVRPRDVSARPFTLVEELRVQAEQKFRATEQQLEQDLRETEEKLNEMQLARGDADLTVLSAEQQSELQAFLDRKVDIRKQLRQVRRDLDKDIESLGAWLKAINILLVPILVAVAALLYFLRRRRLQQTGAGA